MSITTEYLTSLFIIIIIINNTIIIAHNKELEMDRNIDILFLFYIYFSIALFFLCEVRI